MEWAGGQVSLYRQNMFGKGWRSGIGVFTKMELSTVKHFMYRVVITYTSQD
jgi:hypothetical protein